MPTVRCTFRTGIAPQTGSAVAGRLLDGEAADTVIGERFTKVLPRDYARVLAARALAEAEGLDDEATTAKMMEATRG